MGTPAGDDRDPSTVRYDLLVDQVNALVAKMDAAMDSRGSNTQTVIHKTAGIGPWAAAAVTACFCTLIGLILFAAVVIPDLHDLRAWQDIMRSKIAKLEANQ